jgi:signal transduction histidine kinase
MLGKMSPGGPRRIAAVLSAEVTSPPPPRHPRLRLGRFDLVELADILIALIAFGLTNSALTVENSRHGRPHGPATLLLAAFVTCAPLVLRTRFPLTAWSASAAAIIYADLVINPGSLSTAPFLPASVLVYGLCLYAVAVRCTPWAAGSAGAVTVIGAAFLDWRNLAPAVFLTAILLLFGSIVRVRRSGTRRLAEQERRHSGERALLEERQRIARELHDVVAHHMSVIAIQAEAAPYKVADPPKELAESFGEIRASALTGLTELRRVLGVLRSDGPQTAPQPGLADLDALLESARAGGVTVTLARAGSPVTLPESVDLSAYRIVQEALSNAIRHAPGSRVQVHLDYGGEGLAIEVRNTAPARDVAPVARAAGGDGYGGGHGIIGMRERAAMLGGTLDAGPAPDGGFGVSAFLPVGPDQREGPE